MIELLVVVLIIGVLAGMLMPVLGLVRRSANRTNTENLLRKAETALTAFHRDVRSFPYCVPTFAADGSWSNDLGRRLARDMTMDESEDLKDDLAAIKAAYAMGIPPAANGSCYISPAMIRTERGYADWSDPNLDGIRGALSRALVERASVALLAGNTGIQRTVAPGVAHGPWTLGAAVLSTPKSRGFGADYFGGDLQPQELIKVFDATANADLAEGLKDAFGTPLLYINPSVNGILNHPIQFSFSDESNSQRHPAATIDPVRYILRPLGRTATLTIASDIRTTALEQFIFSYEIWSAGSDKRFAPLRNDPSNRDNISATRFAKGLQ